MSIIKDLLDHQEGAKLLKLKDREVRALERIADCLEALLPSPLTSLEHRDLKAPSVDSFKVYGEREAYWNEINNRKKDIADLEDL